MCSSRLLFLLAMVEVSLPETWFTRVTCETAASETAADCQRCCVKNTVCMFRLS